MRPAERFEWTRNAIKRLVWMSLDGDSSHAIAERLGCTERTVRKMQWELELAPRRNIHHWTCKERALLRHLYENTPTNEIARQLGKKHSAVWQQARKLGLTKSIELIRETARERSLRPDHGGRRARFQKGMVPFNKGLRRPGWHAGRMRETQFKKGERRGVAAENYQPIGTIRADPEGYLRIKVRDALSSEHTGFGNVKVWPLLQRHVWEQHKGPIPPNHTVCFKDGDRGRCEIDNLELVSRAELMRRNTIHRYPEELRNAIMLLGAVKRKVREHGEKHNDGSSQPSV